MKLSKIDKPDISPMKIIVFAGIDGSGKSTQAKMLEDFLRSRGRETLRFHATSFSLANLLRPPRRRAAGAARAVESAGPLGVFLRKVVLLVDLGRFFLLRQRLRRRGCDWLLADRYFFDMVLNIRQFSGSNKIGFWEKIVPLPDLSLLLLLSSAEAKRRSRAPEQSDRYLRRKLDLFLERKEIWNLKILPADRSPEEVFSSVLSILEKTALLKNSAAENRPENSNR